MEHRGGYLRLQSETNAGIRGGSYAEAVMRNLTSTAQRGRPIISTRDDGIYRRTRSTVYFDIPVTAPKWLKEAWVGRLINVALYDRIEEELPWEIAATTSPKYIGDDMILLLGLTDEQARNLMDDQVAGQESIFYSMEKWNPSLRPGHRLTWVRCWGIPLSVLDIRHIKQITAGLGEALIVEDDVENLRQLDVARVLIKTSWSPLINHTVSVHMQGEILNVYIIEESATLPDLSYWGRGREATSSEEVLSEKSDTGSPWPVTESPPVAPAISVDTAAINGSSPGEKNTDSPRRTSDPDNIQVAAVAPPPTHDDNGSTLGSSNLDIGCCSTDNGGHDPLPGGSKEDHYPTGTACTQRVLLSAQAKFKIPCPEKTSQNCVSLLTPDPHINQWPLLENGQNQSAGMRTPVDSYSPLHERGNCCVKETVAFKGKEICLLTKSRDQQRSDKVGPISAIHTPTSLPAHHPVTFLEGNTNPNTSSPPHTSKQHSCATRPHALTPQKPLPHQTPTPNDPEAENNSGPVTATHTPSNTLALYHGSPLRTQLAPQNPFSCYSRGTWRKKKFPEAIIAPPLIENETSDHNQSREAQHLWNMALDLGVTSGSMQQGYMQKLMVMEYRDAKEAERLGNKRTTP